MTARESILPPNASPLERALEQGAARITDVPIPLRELWDPEECPLEFLPWLAWALSVDRWEVHWSEGQKRAAVKQAIDLQRRKGTPAAVESVLASFDELLKLTEWHEMRPRGEAHTFHVDLPLISASGDLGGFRSSAEFAEAIIRDVTRVKPARSHFVLRQTLAGGATVKVIGAGRSAGYRRSDFVADTESVAFFETVLTTENGEPFLAEPGNEFLEHEPVEIAPPTGDFVLYNGALVMHEGGLVTMPLGS